MVFICPSGYKIIYDNGSDYSAMAIYCKQCSRGYYTIEKSTFDLTSSKNYSNKCFPCPAGATCYEGKAIAQYGFWGFPDKDQLQFITCPTGYCSDNPVSYDSCSKTRTGVLCGECKNNHSVSIMSSVCIPNSECGTTAVFGVIFAFLSLACALLVTFIEGIVSKVINFVKSKIQHMNCSVSLEEATEDTTGTMIISCVQQLVFFYQIQQLVEVTIPSDSAQHVLRQLLGSIFSLNFVGDKYNVIRYCALRGPIKCILLALILISTNQMHPISINNKL